MREVGDSGPDLEYDPSPNAQVHLNFRKEVIRFQELFREVKGYLIMPCKIIQLDEQDKLY